MNGRRLPQPIERAIDCSDVQIARPKSSQFEARTQARQCGRECVADEAALLLQRELHHVPWRQLADIEKFLRPWRTREAGSDSVPGRGHLRRHESANGASLTLYGLSATQQKRAPFWKYDFCSALPISARQTAVFGKITHCPSQRCRPPSDEPKSEMASSAECHL